MAAAWATAGAALVLVWLLVTDAGSAARRRLAKAWAKYGMNSMPSMRVSPDRGALIHHFVKLQHANPVPAPGIKDLRHHHPATSFVSSAIVDGLLHSAMLWLKLCESRPSVSDMVVSNLLWVLQRPTSYATKTA